MNTQQLANAVKSNYIRLQESEIVGRIIILSGRSFSRSLKGLEVLKQEGKLDGFIEPETAGKMAKMLENNPLLAEMFDKLDLVPGKTIIHTEVKPAKPTKTITEKLNLDVDF
jgi:hypothetical protein